MPDDPDYVRLLDALGHDPVGIDRLAERTGLTVTALSSMLLLMELDGRVTAEHGRYSQRVFSDGAGKSPMKPPMQEHQPSRPGAGGEE
jgi:hypothetical protein